MGNLVIKPFLAPLLSPVTTFRVGVTDDNELTYLDRNFQIQKRLGNGSFGEVSYVLLVKGFLTIIFRS